MIEFENKVSKIKDIVNSELQPLDKYKQLSKVLFERSSKRNKIDGWQIDWMKELRNENFSYEDIVKITGLSMSSVRYHLIAGEKEKTKKINAKSRSKMRANPKAWKAYQDYQREYQRKLADKKKELEKINENENENEQQQQRTGLETEGPAKVL